MGRFIIATGILLMTMSLFARVEPLIRQFVVELFTRPERADQALVAGMLVSFIGAVIAESRREL